MKVALSHILLLTALSLVSGQAQTLPSGTPDGNAVKNFLFLNQTKFQAGDTVWFSTWTTVGGRLPAENHLFYFDLHGNGGSILLHLQYRVEEGKGHGIAVLPEDLTPGYYLVVAGPVGATHIQPACATLSVVRQYQLAPSQFTGIAGGNVGGNDVDDVATARSPFVPEQGPSLNADLTLEPASAKPRSLINLNVQLTQDGRPVKGSFALDVVNHQLDLMPGTTMDTLNGILMGDPRFHPSNNVKLLSYLKASSDSISKNNLIVNQSEELSDLPANIRLVGTILSRPSHKPVAAGTIVAFYLQKTMWHYEVVIGGTNKIQLNLPEFQGKDELLYIARSPGGKALDIEIDWENEPTSMQGVPKGEETITLDPYGRFALLKKAIDRSYNFFAGQDTVTHSGGMESNRFERELTQPDKIVNFADFGPMASMEDAIREIVPSLYERSRRNRKIVRVEVQEPLTTMDDPLYVIDGIATTNTAFFLGLNPANVQSVGIVTSAAKLLPLGILGVNGIVFVHTKQGGVNVPIPANSRVVTGIEARVAFRPVSNLPADAPHFRSTVYWNPKVSTDSGGVARISFPVGDDTGAFSVLVFGLTDTGAPFYGSADLLIGDR